MLKENTVLPCSSHVDSSVEPTKCKGKMKTMTLYDIHDSS